MTTKTKFSFLVKTFVKNINEGNPRTISNLNCLFSTHNWKWVNLSKMAGFNISLNLNERQSSSDKKHNKSLRLILFFPFRCCFAGALPFFLSTVKQTKLLHSISEMFFTFLARKTLSKTFLVECVRSGAANCNKRRGILARNSHTSVAFDWTYHFSHMGKNIVRDSDWTYHFFSRVKTIVRSSDWLELICVPKFTT